MEIQKEKMQLVRVELATLKAGSLNTAFPVINLNVPEADLGKSKTEPENVLLGYQNKFAVTKEVKISEYN